MRNLNNRGQTLLEAIIALGAILIVLSATSVAVVTSLNNSSFVKQQNQANKLAQQGMEYVRDRISTDKFADYVGLSQTVATSTQCLGELSTPSPFTPGRCATANIQNTFKREVTFSSVTQCGSSSSFVDGLEVIVDVSWASGKCPVGNTFCHKQELKSCFIDPSKVGPTQAQGI